MLRTLHGKTNIMSYIDDIRNSKNLDTLFSIWKNKPVVQTSYKDKGQDVVVTVNHRDVFISDGPVDIETWNDRSGGKRILYILKEAYGESSDWSLSDWLRRTAPHTNIWYRITEWTYGILNTTSEHIARYTPEDISFEYSAEEPNKWIKQIAVLNIKKSSGKSESSYGEILAYANVDQEEIKKEIELIDPDIIVCGATANDIDSIVGGELKNKLCDNWYYWSNVIDGKERLYIDYYHPASRYPALMNYYGLVNIYQQALIDKEIIDEQLNRK